MKRILLFTLLLSLAFGGVLSAQETEGDDSSTGQLEPLMAPGDFAVSAGLGYGFFWGAIDVSGGVELIMARHDLGGELPLTFGIAGKVNYYRYNYSGYRSDYYYTYLGGGGFGTVHLGLKDLNLDDNLQFLADVDTYVGIGVGFYSYSNTWDDESDNDYSAFRIGLRSTAGINYFLTPNVAINFEGGYYGAWGGGGLIGVLVKL